MIGISMYNVKRTHDHIDRLYAIINLAKAGAATSDSSSNITHLPAVQCCLFEVIHNLASEAVDIAEMKQDAVK